MRGIVLFCIFLISSVISAQIVSIPDENFEQWLIYWHYDSDAKVNHQITKDDALDIITLIISYEEGNIPPNVTGKILELTGIEEFTNLQELVCENNLLTNIDISNNTDLRELVCSSNQLTSLNLSNNAMLWHLNCDNNQLISLDVSGCTDLLTLVCDSNQLTNLNVSNNTVLTHLSCGYNPSTSLNLCKNDSLKLLYIDHMESLDTVYVWGTFPTSVDVSTEGSPNVTFIPCGVGVREIAQLGMSIYPNPVYDLLAIEIYCMGYHSIEITSLNGQLILSKEFEGPTYQLDLSSYQKGIYFITIRSKDFVGTRKIIKL